MQPMFQAREEHWAASPDSLDAQLPDRLITGSLIPNPQSGEKVLYLIRY
jgi:hypothetical protein